jgi:hypothetical protein
LIRAVHSNMLHIGNALDARDLRLLYETGIRAVIDLAINEPPAQLGREIVYCRFPLNDGDGNSDALITLAIRTIASLIRHNIPTLVACSAGMSRAPSIASGSIALLTDRHPDDCLLQLVTGVPNDVSPTLWSHVKRVYNIDD